jgi:hypothetical protein
MNTITATVVKIGPYENNPSLLGKTLNVDRIEIWKNYNYINKDVLLNYNGNIVSFQMHELEFNVSNEELISITTCIIFESDLISKISKISNI